MKKNNLISGLLGTLTVFSFDDKSASSSDRSERPAGQLTGVSRYISQMPLPTGVDRYLKGQKKNKATSVAKYLAKQLLSDKEKTPSTGVTKYLVKQARLEQGRPAVSRVAKYVARNNMKGRVKIAPHTGVARYIARLVMEKQESMPRTGVDRYQYERDLLETKAHAAKLVEEYIRKQAALAAREADFQAQDQDQVAEKETYDPASTGVSIYLAKLRKREKMIATGVAKYVRKKTCYVATSAPKTGVAKYIARRSTVSKETPTGVAKYITKQILSARRIEPSTGVTKYIEKKKQNGRLKPALSSVSKYLAKQAIIEKNTLVVTKKKNLDEDQCTAVELDAADKKMTGVEQYLSEKTARVAIAPKPLTGVEEYLRAQSRE